MWRGGEGEDEGPAGHGEVELTGADHWDAGETFLGLGVGGGKKLPEKKETMANTSKNPSGGKCPSPTRLSQRESGTGCTRSWTASARRPRTVPRGVRFAPWRHQRIRYTTSLACPTFSTAMSPDFPLSQRLTRPRRLRRGGVRGGVRKRPRGPAAALGPRRGSVFALALVPSVRASAIGSAWVEGLSASVYGDALISAGPGAAPVPGRRLRRSLEAAENPTGRTLNTRAIQTTTAFLVREWAEAKDHPGDSGESGDSSPQLLMERDRWALTASYNTSSSSGILTSSKGIGQRGRSLALRKFSRIFPHRYAGQVVEYSVHIYALELVAVDGGVDEYRWNENPADGTGGRT